ncbi:MAG TPA: hypothetical protein DIW43_18685 [Spongiibacteraceae bacterium]|nr:hypothetical protein [Spongiibacteraceae bacterium]HCS29489.1 hypothetical protein [Spongiibacteraceae bacterium]
MEKLVYLLHRNISVSALSPQLGKLVHDLQRIGAQRIVINIADMDDAVSAAAPQRIAGEWQNLGAVVSLWVDCVDCHPDLEEILSTTGCKLAGYLVTESVPQRGEHSGNAGDRRPGITQFTAHGKPEAISEADFYRNWREHTELSFKLHPARWSYVRNAVVRALTGNAPAYRALVLEHFKALDDFTDESRYFGDPAVVQQMYEELPGFCDFGSMITGPMGEYAF